MQPLRGILLKLASVTLFVVMSSLIKATTGSIPPGEAVFFRSLFAMPVIFAWLAVRGELPGGLRVRSPAGHALRGILGTVGMGLGFTALGLLPLPEVTAIGYAAPLLVVVFAAMFLGERVRAFRLSAVGLGLAGVLVVLWPRLTAFPGSPRESLGAAIVLTSAVASALAQVSVRRLVQTEAVPAIVFWFSATGTALGLATLPFGWTAPGPREAVFLVTAGLLGGLGQAFLTSAYRFADASVVAPFDYASMLLAVAIGFFVFAEAPTVTTLAGAAVIITAGGLIIWRERQLGIERNRARRAMTQGG